MRAATAILVAGAILLGAAPASAEMPWWGPGGTDPGPTYVLPLRVVDGVRSTIPTPERRREWTRQLREALDEWGLAHAIERRPESEQAFPATDENVSTLGLSPLAIPGAIVLVRGRLAAATETAGWLPDVGGGAAIISVWRGFWSGPNGISPTVAHELGHALGFQHGGTGVMSGAMRVNAEERTLAATYYEGGAR